MRLTYLKKSLHALAPYWPLVVIVLCLAAAAAVLVHNIFVFWSFSYWMQYFMGLFFVVFAMFKLFNLKGFVQGFKKYDLPTQAWAPYGYIYPVLELGLGLWWLGVSDHTWVALATLVLMLVSGVGVLHALLIKHMDIRCACLGTTLNVPLSTVSLVETFGMALMAGWMVF